MVAVKTKQVRIRIKEILGEIVNPDNIFYQTADDDTQGIYVVYSFENIDQTDVYRDITKLIIDIWGYRNNTIEVDDIADNIDERLNMANEPCESIYPTFYRYERRPLDDNNKDVYHVQCKYMIQSYE